MDNEEEKPKELTEKQRVFVERYCVHFNGAKACREAGYSEETARTMAHENLTKPNISEAINVRLKVLSMGTEEATKRLSDMARGSMESFLITDNNENVLISLSNENAQENLHLIKKIKQTKRTILGGDEQAFVDVTTELELHDSKDAILNLLKLQGKFNFKQEIEQTVKMETVTLFELPKNGRDENT